MKIALTVADIKIASLLRMPEVKPVNIYKAEDFDFLPEYERGNAARGMNIATGLVIDAAESGLYMPRVDDHVH